MPVYLVLAGLVVALCVGAAGGWTLRGASARWCQSCGLDLGRVCIACHDRRRAAVLGTQDASANRPAQVVSR
jgi:hypothetical protein